MVARRGSAGAAQAPRPARVARAVVVALLAAVGLTLLSGVSPALAVGVDGIEIAPDLPRRGADNRFELEVGAEPTVVRLRVGNIGTETRTVRIYVEAADVVDGQPRLLGGGAPAFVEFADRQVTLAPGEEQVLEGRVLPQHLPPDVTTHHLAFVVESNAGATVTTRAASVVRVVGERNVLVPAALLLFALALVVGVGAMAVQQLRAGRADAHDAAAVA